MQNVSGMDTLLESRIAEGFVLAVDGREEYRVDVSGERITCRRAAGCLLDPATGDLVLLSMSGEEGGRYWILSVLERASGGAPVSLTLHDGAVVSACKGHLALRSEKEIGLHTSGRMSLSADSLDLSARKANWLVRSLSVFGGSIESVWEQARQTVASMQTVCSTWVQHLGDSVRHVKELDETHADHVRIMAKDTLQTQGKFVNHTASEVVKIDGQEVHLG